MASGIFLGGAADGLQSGSKAAIDIMNEKRLAEQQQRAELSKLVEANMAQIQNIFKETAAAGGDVSKLADNPAIQAHLQYVNKFATALGQDPGIYDARVRTMALAKSADEDTKGRKIVTTSGGLGEPDRLHVFDPTNKEQPLTPIDPVTGQPRPVAPSAPVVTAPQPQLSQSDVIPPAQAARVNGAPPVQPTAPAAQAAPAAMPQDDASLPANASPVQFTEKYFAPSERPPNPNVNSEALTGLSEGAQGVIKGVAEGTIDPTKAFSLRKDKNGQSERNNFLQKVKEYDPSFDMTNYQARAKTLAAFKSGVEARKVTALGTVVKHVTELNKDGAALDNWKSDTFGAATKTANEIRNWMQDHKQSPLITNFNNSANAVSNELETAFRGNTTAISGIQEWRKTINPAMASDQIQASTQKLGALLLARMSELKEQWDRGMGHNQDPSITLKLEATRGLLEKMAAGTLFSDKTVNKPDVQPLKEKYGLQ